MLFMGLAFMWFLVAAYAIADLGLCKSRHQYTLYVPHTRAENTKKVCATNADHIHRTWWAVVFPIVTLNTAMIQLAKSMDSPAFRVLATALFVCLLIAYLINLTSTIWSIFKGDIFFPSVESLTKHKEVHDTQHDTDRSDGPLLV